MYSSSNVKRPFKRMRRFQALINCLHTSSTRGRFIQRSAAIKHAISFTHVVLPAQRGGHVRNGPGECNDYTYCPHNVEDT